MWHCAEIMIWFIKSPCYVTQCLYSVHFIQYTLHTCLFKNYKSLITLNLIKISVQTDSLIISAWFDLNWTYRSSGASNESFRFGWLTHDLSRLQNPFNVLSLGECYNWMDNRCDYRQKAAMFLKSSFEFSILAVLKEVGWKQWLDNQKILTSFIPNIWFEHGYIDAISVIVGLTKI